MNTRSSRSVVAQSCPNCGKLHDTSIFVSGQVVTCACGIRFEVKRSDVKPASPSKVDLNKTINARGSSSETKSIDIALETPSSEGLEHTVASSKSQEGAAVDPGSTSVAPAPQVPGYELVELLGKGGMGEVWRARQVSLSRMVAVKLLPSRFAKDREFVARFDKEATALAALSHPGVVQIIDRGQAGEHYFFAMELVAGINLREMMASGRLSIRDALRIGTQVARAIDYAHEMKVVHRDLKPENILVDARGHVKIADFGLAGMKGNERDISLTATAVAMGTVNYMAPEQRRDAKHVDHRADLYSLGVLLYEMLTGELPIGRFKLPTQKVPGLDARVDEVVGALLETEPEARPARANVVAEVLEAVTPGSNAPGALNASAVPGRATPAVEPAPLNSRPGSFVQEPGAGWKLGVFVLGALLLLGVVLKLWPESNEAPPLAAPPAWYHDSEDEELFSAVTLDEKTDAFTLSFEPGDAADGGEEINLHAGLWKQEGGALTVTQYGDALASERLVPRAYVAKRYFVADRLEAAVDVEIDPLPPDFPPVDYKNAQHFAELAFRINDLQVSVFAIPGTDMRIGWRYFRKDGREEEGNSARELEALQEDPVRVPNEKFRLRLRLTAMKNGDVTAEAFVNSTRITRQVLPGLTGQVGKIALGCRNHVCRFDNLTVSGQTGQRPSAPQRKN
ncbi:MAG: serine/threonine-protein kinase [Myxococcota bacterium]